MINDKISPLQLTKLRKLPTGMTESSHLSQAWLTEPEKMDAVLAYAFGTQNENVLSMLTGGLGNTKFINNREYTWELHGQNERSVEITRNHVGGGTTPGVGGSTFKVYTDEKIYVLSDVLVTDNGTQIRVQEEPYMDGMQYVHICQLVDPNIDFIDPTQVDLGARLSKDYSIVEEFSSKGGSTNYQAPMRLTNQLTTLRKQYSVTRSAATDVMVIELFSEGGESTKLWTKLAEWTALAQWYKEIDKSMIYTTYNKSADGYVTLQGENKRAIYTGAGLRQQISPANIRYYSKLTYDILDEFLLDLSYAAKKWGGNHNFVALTGKMGMREFDRAIKDHARGNNITVTDSGTFITGSGDSLKLTGYFKTVEFLSGISLTVKEFPPYDDIVRNRTLHPVTKKPIESYRFTILNFGSTAKGKSNIRKVAKANSENAMWHVCGSTTPFGDVAKSASTMRSSPIDGYEVHMLAEVGIQLEDPTSCGELIMDLNY